MDGLSGSFSCSTTIVGIPRIIEHVHETDMLAIVVMTKPKEKDGVTKYHVYRRVSIIDLGCSMSVALICPVSQPIPLDLLTLANFTDPATQRGNSMFRLGRSERHAGDAGTPTGAATSPESATDSRLVFPCTIHHNGRLGGLYTVFAESTQARSEWKQKLEEAIGLRKVVQDSNKVFEIETLSADTFLVPSMMSNSSNSNSSWGENAFTGKVTCSVPFSKYLLSRATSLVLMDPSQLPPMAVVWSPLVVLKVSGLVSGTIRDVSAFKRSNHNIGLIGGTSAAPCASSQDGHTMCYARGLRYLPRIG